MCVGFFKVNRTLYDNSPTLSYFQCRWKWNVPWSYKAECHMPDGYQTAVPHNWRIWSDCASADGQVLPPYVVYSCKILYLNWTRDGYPGSWYSTSENGWMDSNVYRDWFKRMFILSIGREGPVLLIYDGHASHIGIQVIKLVI